jgi:hypothetical protein
VNRTLKIVVIVVVALVAIRLAMPYFITKYVNKVLSEMEGYTGSIDGVDLWLIRGAYQIHELDIYSVKENIQSPFFLVDTIDISVEWKALFDGSIVSEITFLRPELNFILNPETNQVEAGEENDWTRTVKDLTPLKINKLTVVDGKVAYVDNSSSPKIDLYFHQLQMVAENLTNAKDIGDSLPSPVVAHSTSIGGGDFDLKMKINVLKQVPDFDLNAKLENVEIPALNDFLDAYAKVDAEAGTFNLYTEVALIDSHLTGYVKPVAKDLKLLDWSEEAEDEGFFRKVWEGVASLGKEALENPKEDQVASKVPIEGHIDAVGSAVWPAILSLLKNAFLKPLQNNIDQTIQVNSRQVIKGEGKENKKD